MISIEKLAEILNNELSRDFLKSAIELWDDGDLPIDPEHPDMEVILDRIAESINDEETLPIKDNYV